MDTYDKVRAPRPCPTSPELHLAQGAALAHPSAPELPARQSDRQPCDLPGTSAQFYPATNEPSTYLVGHAHDVLEPTPELSASDETRAEAENTDAARREQCEERHARAGRPGEDGWRLWGSCGGEAVQHTRSSEERVIACRKDGGEDDGVHK